VVYAFSYAGVWLVERSAYILHTDAEARRKLMLTLAPVLAIVGVVLMQVLYHTWDLATWPYRNRFDYHMMILTYSCLLIFAGLVCLQRAHWLKTGQLK
jgi:hypothetical protein